MAYFENEESGKVITGTAEADEIYNYGDSVTIDAGDGDDFIDNWYNIDPVTVNAGSGNDTILNGGDNSSIDGNADNDEINNVGWYSIIDGGDDADTIFNGGWGSTIIGNAGDDSIKNGSDSVTIEGGTGDDYIDNIDDYDLNEDGFIGDSKNVLFIYKAGDGNDTVKGFNETSTLLISSENYYSQTSGSDVIVTIGTGSIILRNAAELTKINIVHFVLTEGDDFLNNTLSGVTINALGGNDIISNGGNHMMIEGGSGDDSINNNGTNSIIKGGAGADYISNTGASVSINGGTGNDLIVNRGSNISIEADKGDDSISNYDSNVTITGGTGNDSIYNIGDTVTINGGTDNDSIVNRGSNVLIDAGEGEGSISNHGSNVTITGGAGNDSIINTGASVSINGGDGDDYLNNAVYLHDLSVTIDGGTGNDTIYNSAGNVTINGGTGDDFIGNLGISSDSVTIDGGEGDDYIYDNPNVSYGSMNGGAGDDNIVTYGASSTISGGAGNDTIELLGRNTLIQYKNGDGNDLIQNFDPYDTISIVSDTYSSEQVGSDLILTIGEGSITLENVARLEAVNVINTSGETTKISLTPINLIADDKTDSTVILGSVTEIFDASKRTKPINITGNDLNNTITGGRKNDTINGGGGENLLTGGKGKDLFLFSEGNDTITDFSAQDKISVASAYENFSVNGSDLIFNFGEENSLTIKNGAGKALNLNSVVNIYSADGIFDATKKSATLASTAENFSAKNYSNLTTIDGSQTNSVSITGNSKANFIRAGFNSTIAGGKGKDTIFGGDGADIFAYAKGDGKDTIFNFGEGDKISLGSGAEIKDVKIKKGDSIIKIGSGSITVNDTTEIIFTANGEDTIFSNGIFIGESSAKVLGSFSGEINLGELGVSTADASDAKKKISIIGSDSDDLLIGGKAKDTLNGGAGADTLEGGKGNDILFGGEGNDSLWGGKGNDTLTGGAGDDTFVFRAGDGNDVITDFSSGDMLQILNKKGTGFVDYKKATFKNDTLTLTINGGGKIILKDILDSTSININGMSRTVSSMI